MRELRRLLRASAEQAGWSGVAATDASGFQRDQTSHYYRNRTNYSFQSLKTTILIDVNSLAIKDVHYTTRKSWDGHIGLQVFRRNAEDLRILTADANYSWSDLREECRAESTRPLVKRKEQAAARSAQRADGRCCLPPAVDERNRLLAVEARRWRDVALPELARPVPGTDPQVYHA